MKNFKIIAFLVLGPLLGHCKVSSQADGSNLGSVSRAEQSVSKTDPTKLVLSNSSLDGAEVVLPAAGLPEGSVIALDTVETSPFSLDKTPAASAVAVNVSAKDISGNDIENLSSPMSLSIPATSTTLQLVDASKTTSNLCIYLETAITKKKMVWYSGSFTFDTTKNLAIVSSNYLGTFQLVYCGKESDGLSKGFANAKNTSTSKVQFTVDTSLFPASDDLCLFLTSESSNSETSSTDKILASAYTSVTGSEEKINLLWSNLGKSSDKLHLFLIALTKGVAGSSCPTSGSIDKLPSHYKGYAFDVTKEKLIAGSANGTFGSSNYSVKTISLEVGDPLGLAGTVSMKDLNVCVYGKVSDYGFFETTLSLSASGLLNGEKNVSLSIPYTTGKTIEGLRVFIGSTCNEKLAESKTTNHDESSVFLKTSVDDAYYMSYVNMEIPSLIVPNQSSVCLALFDGTQTSGVRENSEPIFITKVALDEGLPVLIPWDTSKLDANLVPVVEGSLVAKADCFSDSKEDPATELFTFNNISVNDLLTGEKKLLNFLNESGLRSLAVLCGTLGSLGSSLEFCSAL